MRRQQATATFFVLAVVVAGCGERQPESGTAEPAATYRVRGIVRGVGDGSLHIRHEAIPGFRDPGGDIVGMESMSMDFAVDDEVSVEELAVGDKVSFELRVDWDASRPARITSLEVLPADTPLLF